MTTKALSARVSGVLLVLLLTGAAWFWAAPAASAHALLVSSNPATGAALTQLPKDVTCTFSEDIVVALSSVQVLDSSGHVVSSGKSHAVAPGNALTLEVPLPTLLGGVYTVEWKTVSSDDGHVATGSFTFGVGPLAYAAMSGPAPQLLSAPSSATPLSVSGRWLFDSGLGLLVGGCWIALYGYPVAIRRLLILAFGGAGVMLIGLGVSGWAQASTDQIGLSELASTSLGLGLILQAVPGLAAAACTATATATTFESKPKLRKYAVIAALIFAGFTDVAHVLTTHAASGDDAGLEIVSEWVHVAAFATWIGGLAALLLALGAKANPSKAAAVRRFSRIAAYSLAALCVSGVVRAFDEVGAWHALADTFFGRLVVIKAGMVAAIAAIGAYNRYRSVPAAEASLKRLRRAGTAELGLAGVALVVAAILSSSLPPALVQAEPKQPTPPSVVVTGTAPGLRATLAVSPGYPGLNKFTLRVYDASTGRVLTATDLKSGTLTFTSPGHPGDTEDPLALAPTGDGGLSGTGEELEYTGRWDVDAKVRTPEGAVTIPFTVTCNPSPDQIEEMTMGRMSMVYGVQLADAKQLEAYLSPNRPGRGSLHLVFTDQRNAPIELAALPRVTVHQDGSTAQQQSLAMQPVGEIGLGALCKGQFFTGTDFTTGRWDFQVQARESNGTVLTADFALTVGQAQ